VQGKNFAPKNSGDIDEPMSNKTAKFQQKIFIHYQTANKKLR
jgi:hypothetical protein